MYLSKTLVRCLESLVSGTEALSSVYSYFLETLASCIKASPNAIETSLTACKRITKCPIFYFIFFFTLPGRIEILASSVGTLSSCEGTFASYVETLASCVETLAYSVGALASYVQTLASRVRSVACYVETLPSCVGTLVMCRIITLCPAALTS